MYIRLLPATRAILRISFRLSTALARLHTGALSAVADSHDRSVNKAKEYRRGLDRTIRDADARIEEAQRQRNIFVTAELHERAALRKRLGE